MPLEVAILSVIVLVFSVVIHEVAHGWMANRLGDPTARYAGRLTLNPIPHIDPFWSLLLPAALIFSNSPIVLGAAKPVPYNPHNLPGRWGEALVALAGPATNLGIAIVFGILMRAGLGGDDKDVLMLLFMIVQTNVVLAIFNLVPIPPLDGSKIASAVLPRQIAVSYEQIRSRLEQNPLLGMAALVGFILVLGKPFGFLVFGISRLIAGI
jgi:Zn-dependent protease